MCHYFWFGIKDSHSSVTYYCCMLCLVSLVKLLIFGHYLWPFLGKLSRNHFHLFLSVCKIYCNVPIKGVGNWTTCIKIRCWSSSLFVVTSWNTSEVSTYVSRISSITVISRVKGLKWRQEATNQSYTTHSFKSRPPKEWCEKKSSNISCTPGSCCGGKWEKLLSFDTVV